MYKNFYPWANDALCGGEDPSPYDDSRSGNTIADLQRRTRTIALCCECTVMVSCLIAGLRDKYATGIWGGTDEKERDEWRKSGKADKWIKDAEKWQTEAA